MIRKLILTVLLGISLIGCGSSGTSLFGEQTGSIAARLDWQQKSGALARSAASVSKVAAVAPEDVVTIRIIVTAGKASIQKDFPASDGQAVIDGVPVGIDRAVIAQSLNSSGVVIYEGFKTKIIVNSGQTTDIGTVILSTPCASLVSQGDFVSARDTCVSAAEAYGDAILSAADEARFFAGMSMVAALGFNVQSDGNPNNGLNTLGDILDAFGCALSRDPISLVTDSKSLNGLCPSIVPPSAPKGSDLQAFTTNVIQPELEGAVQILNKVSPSFTLTWTEPFGNTQVKSDDGDVFALKAVSEYLLGFVLVDNSYNLEADLATLSTTTNTTESFLAANPNFLRLANTSGLSTAKTWSGNALGDSIPAIVLMRARTGDPSSYFISLNGFSESDIIDTIRYLNLLTASLTAPTKITDKYGVYEGTLDLSIFFAGVDIRILLPEYNGNKQAGPYPDPTFSGIWTDYVVGSEFDPNRDWETQKLVLHYPMAKGPKHKPSKKVIR